MLFYLHIKEHTKEADELVNTGISTEKKQETKQYKMDLQTTALATSPRRPTITTAILYDSFLEPFGNLFSKDCQNQRQKWQILQCW